MLFEQLSKFQVMHLNLVHFHKYQHWEFPSLPNSLVVEQVYPTLVLLQNRKAERLGRSSNEARHRIKLSYATCMQRKNPAIEKIIIIFAVGAKNLEQLCF